MTKIPCACYGLRFCPHCQDGVVTISSNHRAHKFLDFLFKCALVGSWVAAIGFLVASILMFK